MSNKTLLICSPSSSLRGGVESIVNDLSRELPNRGWDVVLGLGKGSRYNDVTRYRQTYPDLSIVELDGTAGTQTARIAALKRTIRKVHPDVVLSARIYDTYYAVNSLKKDNLNVRLAITIQSYEPHYFYDASRHRESIDLCVAAGEMIRAAAVEWSGIPEDFVVSIPAVVRAPNQPPTPRQPRDQMRIGYVGRLDHSDKRILDLVPLIQDLEKRGLNYTFAVVGDGAEAGQLREELTTEVDKGRVRFLGWRDWEYLYKHVYPELDCIVNFSPAEGVSVVGGEAMSHGVVPVFSKFVGMSAEGQYINDVNALTFQVGNMTEAGKCIERLYFKPGLLTRLSVEAERRMRTEKYCFDRVMAAWVKALNDCVKRPASLDRALNTSLPPDGRLTRLGIPSGMAQGIRNLLGRKHIHTDPGSEWPTGSGLLTDQAAQSIMKFATAYEQRSNGIAAHVV